MNKIYHILYVGFVSLCVCSCYLEETPDNAAQLGYRTVLFYLGGDNSLSEGSIDETQQKLDALREAWSLETGLGGHLLVYQDSRKQPARLLEILPATGGNNSKPVRDSVIAEYGVENSASSPVFSRVINDMYTHYPSMDYGLVVCSHGSGWLPEGTNATPRSIDTRTVITDGNDNFELRDFASSIPDGQFSFIVFESNLMAGLEVAYELRTKTDFLIASSAEVVTPGFTPVYKPMLTELFKAYPFYKQAAEAYYNFYDAMPADQRAATISVIRTAKLEPLKKLLHQAESRVADWEGFDRKKLQAFDRRTNAQGHLFYDLAGYMELIGTPEESTAFADSLAQAVIYHSATPEFLPDTPGGFTIARHSGMTLYIPDVHYPYLNEQRRLLRLFQ